MRFVFWRVFVLKQNASEDGLSHVRKPRLRAGIDARASPKIATLRFLLLPPCSPVSRTWAGKQKTAPKDRYEPLISLIKSGAGEGIRTLDPDLGKVGLFRFLALERFELAAPD